MLHNIFLTVGLVAAILIAATIVRWITRKSSLGALPTRSRLWIAQAPHLGALFAIVVVVIYLWSPMADGVGPLLGWSAAGLTIALHRVVTAFAGYLIILRGNVFSIGDRIVFGGVRGDVVGLSFTQTTIMEIGQSQYSGRIVRVTNDKLFDEPVSNHTRDFPFVWEELALPITFDDDYRVVERLLLDTARRHTAEAMREAARALEQVRRKYFLSETPSVEPRVYIRITENWNELSVRFIVAAHAVRAVKDAMSRDLLTGLREAGIGIASTTNAIVEVPPINVRMIG